MREPNDEEFLEELYSVSELITGNDDDSGDKILKSFRSAFVSSHNENLDLKRILMLIDHSKLSLTEKLLFLIVTIPMNNEPVYNSEERRAFFKRVESDLIRDKGQIEAREILQGLE